MLSMIGCDTNVFMGRNTSRAGNERVKDELTSKGEEIASERESKHRAAMLAQGKSYPAAKRR